MSNYISHAQYHTRRYANEVQKADYSVAEVVHILHFISKNVLHVMVLIMGTAVLLGAFVAYLHFPDLLLIPAGTMGVKGMIVPASLGWFHQVLAAFFLKIFWWPRSFRKLDGQYRRRFQLSLLFQALVSLPSFALPIYRFFEFDVDKIPDSENNLKSSLLIFYSLVFMSAVVSISSVAIPFFALRNPMEESILVYYDEILAAKLSSGFQVTQKVGGDQVCEMAFNILGRVLTKWSSLRETAGGTYSKIVEGYRWLMTYLCIGDARGIDYVQRALKGDDTERQEAALNVVFFWADPYWGRLESRDVKFSKELLEIVAEKLMGPAGQVLWAAANCFCGLAKRDPEFLVNTIIVSSKQCVLHRLTDLVDDSTDQSERVSQAVVRTLVVFCNTHYNRPQTVMKTSMKLTPQTLMWSTIPLQIYKKMVLTLKRLLANARAHSLRTHCAYLLLLLDELDGQCIPLFQAIQPRHDAFWYESEKKVLDSFYDYIYIPQAHHRPRYPDDVRPDDIETFTIQPSNIESQLKKLSNYSSN